MTGGGIVVGVWCLWMTQGHWARGWMWPVLLSLVFVFFASLAFAFALRSRTRRLLKDVDCRLCLNCRYVLRDLPDQGVCPECGEGYDLNYLRAEWRDAYRVP